MSWQVLVYLIVLGVLCVWAFAEIVVAMYYARKRSTTPPEVIREQIRAQMRRGSSDATEEPFYYHSSDAPLVHVGTMRGTFGGEGPDVSNIPKHTIPRAALPEGWRVIETAKGELIVSGPDGGVTVDPGDRSITNRTLYGFALAVLNEARKP